MSVVNEEVKNSKMYEKLKARYEKGYCTKQQLARYVDLGVISADEYEEIVGETCTTEGRP